jgi:hypothetical protein
MKTIEMSQQEMRATNGGTRETTPDPPMWADDRTYTYESGTYTGASPMQGDGINTDGNSIEAQAS